MKYVEGFIREIIRLLRRTICDILSVNFTRKVFLLPALFDGLTNRSKEE